MELKQIQVGQARNVLLSNYIISIGLLSVDT